jgi:putative transposase
MREGNRREEVQRDFLTFTAQTIKFDLQKNHPNVLPYFEANLKDRKYQFWKQNPLSVDLYTHAVFIQKLEYIHWSPVKGDLCELPEDYEYSSASFCEN